jgi:hypothetical protein
MIGNKVILIVINLVLYINLIKADDLFDKNYFRSPVDINLAIVSNFGELRNNHFHNGLDIRTNGIEGLNIYAVADGYVSRIKVSSIGYGLVLYITHPIGYVSVYAHLKSFNDSITSYVKKAQYLNETWEIELFPDKKSLPVKKGDIIALSGNSGSSQGPHLHFEIREEETEITVNPLLFGFDIPDNVPPIIKSAYIYPIGPNSYVNGINHFLKLPCKGHNGIYNLMVPQKIVVTGTFGLAVDAIDQVSGTPNPNGVYSIEVLMDGQQVFFCKFAQIGFDENRYINSHCDYVVRKKTGAWIQKCFIDPGNKLGIYKRTTNNGKLSFNESGEHIISYKIGDIKGNYSILNFKLFYEPSPSFTPNPVLKPYAQTIFKFDQPNEFKTDEIHIKLPPYILYDDINFEYYTKNESNTTTDFSWNKIHFVHNDLTPVHSYYDIAINAKYLPEEYYHKAVIISYDSKNGKKCEGGYYDNGWIKTKTRTFGGFKVAIDKTPPTIKPLSILPGKNLSKAKGFALQISDNLSGIKYYKGYIDNKWILMPINKGGIISYHFEPEISKGKHEFKLIVCDQKNNQSEYSAWFIR